MKDANEWSNSNINELIQNLIEKKMDETTTQLQYISLSLSELLAAIIYLYESSSVSCVCV